MQQGQGADSGGWAGSGASLGLRVQGHGGTGQGRYIKPIYGGKPLILLAFNRYGFGLNLFPMSTNPC